MLSQCKKSNFFLKSTCYFKTYIIATLNETLWGHTELESPASKFGSHKLNLFILFWLLASETTCNIERFEYVVFYGLYGTIKWENWDFCSLKYIISYGTRLVTVENFVNCELSGLIWKFTQLVNFWMFDCHKNSSTSSLILLYLFWKR